LIIKKIEVKIVDSQRCPYSGLSGASIKILLNLKHRHALKDSNNLFETWTKGKKQSSLFAVIFEIIF